MAPSGNRESFDALVIGAGPSGGTAALMLAKAGWSVAVVEKSPFPRRKVCGEFVSATSLPVLFELGLGKSFQELAGPEVRRVALFADRITVEAPLPKAKDPEGAWGRALGREHLDSLLLESARRAGARVWQPWTAETIERDDEKWLCHMTAEGATKQISARVVIAACGSWQRGPLSFPGPDDGKNASDLFAFKAHFRGGELADDLMPLLVFPGGYGGMVHSDGGRLSLSCCIRRDTLQGCRERGPWRAADAVFRHICHSCEGVRQVLRGAETDGNWLSVGPIRPGIRKCYVDGVFVVGNLAGESHPVIAEGISMAMQSAWLLCRLLIEARPRPMNRQSRDEIGRAYSLAWRRNFATRTRVAAGIAHLAMRPPAVALWSPLVTLSPALLTIGAQMSGKARRLRFGSSE